MGSVQLQDGAIDVTTIGIATEGKETSLQQAIGDVDVFVSLTQRLPEARRSFPVFVPQVFQTEQISWCHRGWDGSFASKR